MLALSNHDRNADRAGWICQIAELSAVEICNILSEIIWLFIL